MPPVDCTPKRKPELFKPAEIFASATAPAWELMAPQATDRTYHSGAVLHPDGTVVSGGGLELNPLGCNQFQLPTECLSGVEGPSWHSFEVFSPPYMFQGVRPVIVASEQIHYGAQFSITAQRAGSDTSGEFRVALVAPGTATHGFDFNQRYIKLRWIDFIPGSPALISVEAPANSRHAPPGWYMLTVVNSSGVPSVAKWVQVGS